MGAGVILPQPDTADGVRKWTQHGLPFCGKYCACVRPYVLCVCVCVMKHFRETVADEKQQELLNKRFLLPKNVRLNKKISKAAVLKFSGSVG